MKEVKRNDDGKAIVEGVFTIVDEVCICGHLMTMHAGASNHEKCAEECDCKKFRWNGKWVMEEVREKKEDF